MGTACPISCLGKIVPPLSLLGQRGKKPSQSHQSLKRRTKNSGFRALCYSSMLRNSLGVGPIGQQEGLLTIIQPYRRLNSPGLTLTTILQSRGRYTVVY